MNKLLLASVASGLALAAFARAQTQTFVVPSKGNLSAPGAVWNDRASQIYVLWGTTSATLQGSHTQYLYDHNDIPIQAANVSAMLYRTHWQDNLTTGSSYTLSISLSNGPNLPAGASTTFANNHGPNLTQVFSGTINQPAVSSSPSWPAPWQAPIVFSQPFPYIAGAGQSLVVDIDTTASSAQRTFQIEGYRLEAGNAAFEYYDSDCRNSAGGTSGGFGWSPETLIPGGSLSLSVSGAPPATPSFANNAMFFALGGRGTPFGPFTTPFPLTSLGVPAPATCEWATGNIVLGVPVRYNDYGTSASLSFATPVPIPNLPALAGATFYTESIGLDMVGGQPSLFPLTTIAHTIGTGITIPASRVNRLYDSTGASPTTGSVKNSEAATFQFVY
ncbi:MAG: hypothetical protein IPM29_19560 [Planctomycetes bacterium]|nr:hypothetical protein [Planctomycetota bacterium]